MQSFRPLQRHAVSQWGTRALGHSRVARIWPGQRRGQINWVETLRYKHLFRTGIPGFLFTLSLLYLDNELYADPLSGLAGSTVYTTGLNLSLCGLSWGDNTGCRDTDQWPGLVTTLTPPWVGEVRGPRPGITALKWSVITTNFTLLRPLSAPAMTDHFYQLFFNPITSPILFTVSMFNNCLEWHLECSNKTGWN